MRRCRWCGQELTDPTDGTDDLVSVDSKVAFCEEAPSSTHELEPDDGSEPV